jgi:hypothetical protein
VFVATAAQLWEEFQGQTTASVLQPPVHSRHSDREKRARLRSLIKPLSPRPSRVKLERACRIALMETEGPAAVEMIYDRILRRGSLMFWGYKRPFRAIALAMGALVKMGEASLLKTERQRRWQRATPPIFS